MKGEAKLVKLLLDNGADPTKTCSEGTAADIAYGQGLTEVKTSKKTKIALAWKHSLPLFLEVTLNIESGIDAIGKDCLRLTFIKY